MHPKSRLQLDDTNSFTTLAELAGWLEMLLHEPCSIWEKENGELVLLQIRQLVARLNGLKIEVYPNEHPPPHFHVTSPKVSASFTIDECKKLEGVISSGDLQKVRYWHQSAKSLLIDSWNSSRPTNCVVGQFKES